MYFMMAMKQVSLHINNSAGIGTHQRLHNIMHCTSLDHQYSKAKAHARSTFILYVQNIAVKSGAAMFTESEAA